MLWGRIWWLVVVVAFAAIAMAETFLPFRSLPSSTPRRWISNSLLFAVSQAVVLLAYQLSGIALAFIIRPTHHGLLNRAALRYGAQFAIGFVALDLTAYISHRLFHAIAPLWRLHQVHHSETDVDLTTGIRFHPLEALFSQGFFLTAIALLGPPPGAVGFASVAFIAQDFFEHANLRLPKVMDRILRLMIITPAMHHVHHSEVIPEQNMNFGTVFSLWDRLFGTYLAGYLAGASQRRYGLVEIPNGSEVGLARLLLLPFRRAPRESSSREAALRVE